MTTNVATHNQTEEFDNRMQRKTFERNRVEVTELWNTIHNEKLTIYNPRKILEGLSNKEQRLGRVCGTNGSEKSLSVKPGGKRSLGRPTFRCDNIKKGLKQAGLVLPGFI